MLPSTGAIQAIRLLILWLAYLIPRVVSVDEFEPGWIALHPDVCPDYKQYSMFPQ